MKRILFFTIFAIIFLSVFSVQQYLALQDGTLHVIFCNVGQGDGIFIKTPTNKYILIDAGPDKSISNCLSRHMPFWKQTIDLAILTHPHSDHYSGFYYVLQRYGITHFVTEDLKNKTAGFAELLQILDERKIPRRYVLAGDRWRIGDVTLTVAGPTREFLTQTSPGGFIGEGKEFASVITRLSYGSFDAFFTGDSQVVGLVDAKEYITNPIDILQVPHHGSASGLDTEVLDRLQPKLAVISVGAKNRYGHPTKRTLNLLQEKGIKVLRTDKHGDVEIVSDGKTWQIL